MTDLSAVRPDTPSANPSTNKGIFKAYPDLQTANGKYENMCMEVVNSDIRYINPLESGVRFVPFRKPFEVWRNYSEMEKTMR